jgi:pantoate--beta-alanine ligase
MKIVSTIEGLRSNSCAKKNRRILVPTMGALHAGHVSLIRLARKNAGRNGEVVVSIFVNPLQFEPGSDFSRYPRPESADEEICRAEGVDLIFRPLPDEIYFTDRSTFVEETALSERLCGASRPGHFRGVCTVVAKLFHLLAPAAALFGEKDFQQLAIIRRMVRDLDFPVEIIAGPTIREADGLALSSRNQYLKRKNELRHRSSGSRCWRRHSRRRHPPVNYSQRYGKRSSRRHSPGLIMPRSWARKTCNHA